MTDINDIANSVYLLKMRLNRIKGAEDELLARGTQHKQTRTGRTGGTGKVGDKMSLNIGSADRTTIQRDTNIYPKPHNRKMDRDGKRTGDKIPMTGTAGVGGEKQTFNPAGSKTDTHRTAQGPISSSGILGSGRDRKNKPTKDSPGYYFDRKRTRTIPKGKKPKGYAPPDYKPTPESDVKERISYPVHSEEEREELHTTPGKDFDKKVAEQKERRRIASQRKQRKREMKEKYPEYNETKPHDNRLKPGESFTPKKRENEDVPESSKLRTDRGRRAAERGEARSQLSHGGSKQHGEKGSEHGKERELRHGKLTRQNEGNKRVSGRETKDTKYFDYQGTETGTGSKGKKGKDAEPETNETIEERFPKSTKEGEKIGRKREQQKEREDKKQEKREADYDKKLQSKINRKKPKETKEGDRPKRNIFPYKPGATSNAKREFMGGSRELIQRSLDNLQRDSILAKMRLERLQKDGAIKPSKSPRAGKIDNHQDYTRGGSKDYIPPNGDFEDHSEFARNNYDRPDKARHQKYGEKPKIEGQSHSPALRVNDSNPSKTIRTAYLDNQISKPVESKRDSLGGRGGGKPRFGRPNSSGMGSPIKTNT